MSPKIARPAAAPQVLRRPAARVRQPRGGRPLTEAEAKEKFDKGEEVGVGVLYSRAAFLVEVCGSPLKRASTIKKLLRSLARYFERKLRVVIVTW